LDRGAFGAMNHPPLDQLLGELQVAVRDGQRAKSTELTDRLLECGAAPDQILAAMVAAMDEVGRRFQCQEIFIPQMLMASRAMTEAMDRLAPKLSGAGVKPRHRALIGTVAGDVHNIGKNLVAMMWRGAGFEVIDLGTNVTASGFLKAADEHQPDLIGLSALLTTTMPAVKTIVEALAPVRAQGVRVAVGGAPLSQAFANNIGADGYAPDAVSAVELARRLVGKASTQ
jgi:5-methyltetrahydrofolate--homocysteine methyltransferase